MKFAGILCVLIVLSMLFIPVMSLSKVSENPQTAVMAKTSHSKYSSHTPEQIKVFITSSGKVRKMSLFDYTVGSVCAEISPVYEPEAIMAQAVACRTYAIYMIENNVYDKADISDDYSIHQGYVSKEELKKKWGEKFDEYFDKISSAVKQVEKKVILYDGKIIQPAYFALCSGKTENAKDVWGNDTPYLKSVVSVGDELAGGNTSVVSISEEEFKNCAKNLKNCDLGNDISQWIGEIERSDAGGVKKIAVGKNTYSISEFQRAFNLKSGNFTVSFENGMFIFNVVGNGHAVGMSQYGADYMARQGSSYEEILKHYYTGVEISDY